MDCKAEPCFRFVAVGFLKINRFAMAHTKDILSMKQLHSIFLHGKYKLLCNLEAISISHSKYCFK